VIDPFVDWAWVLAYRREVILVDARWYLDGRSGQGNYEQGHIPGAIFVDLDRQLTGLASTAVGRHPLPDAAVFAEAVSTLGIGDGATVIAYDDEGGVIAARIVWMLRALGENAALLDGGLTSYRGPFASGSESLPLAMFSLKSWPQIRIANINEASDLSMVVIDARNRDRYRGENEKMDPRAGHIPGAINIPCRENLNPDGTLLPADQIRKRFELNGIRASRDVISYCGSGVTACHNLLAMEFAGLGQGRLFPGSWSEYSHARQLPVATGSQPK
jgi:thiosulfate/3-mercaptopyruvate sulfurtransferase